jgi:hypothetical protein
MTTNNDYSSQEISDFSIPVGGDGGKVWEIKHVTKSVFTLLNVPPYVATSRENLLVPQELLPEK